MNFVPEFVCGFEFFEDEICMNSHVFVSAHGCLEVHVSISAHAYQALGVLIVEFQSIFAVVRSAVGVVSSPGNR